MINYTFFKHIFTETADFFLLNSIMKLQVCMSKHAVNPMNQLWWMHGIFMMMEHRTIIFILKWSGKKELISHFSQQPVMKSGTRGPTLIVRPLVALTRSLDCYINMENNSAKCIFSKVKTSCLNRWHLLTNDQKDSSLMKLRNRPGRLLRLFLEPKSLTREKTLSRLGFSQFPLVLLGLLTQRQALFFSRSLACLFCLMRELAIAAAMASLAAVCQKLPQMNPMWVLWVDK